MPRCLVLTSHFSLPFVSPDAEKALKEERNRYVEHLEHWVDQRLYKVSIEQAERKFAEEIFLSWADASLIKDLEMKGIAELHQLGLQHSEQTYNAKIEIENEKHSQVR